MADIVAALPSQPHVLTIAGSDSGGGAGIQADLKTIATTGCYGSSVITAVTAQNTVGVRGVHEVPPDFVAQQLAAVFDDDPPVAVKIGMLTSSSIIDTTANFLTSLKTRPVVVLDPVMISTSGHTLLPADAISAITSNLVKAVDWITPNIPEARRLLGASDEVASLSDLLSLANKLRDTFDLVVLLKGGHFGVPAEELKAVKSQFEVIWAEGTVEDESAEVLSLFETEKSEDEKFIVDILVEQGKDLKLLVGKQLRSSSTHGTGCTLSSAIACALANKGPSAKDNTEAARSAIQYVRNAISSALPFGQGHGPLNHSHSQSLRALPLPTACHPHPFTSHLIQSDLPLWKEYVRHPFVVQLGEGTLPRECFEHYIKQDYHYLRHYARAHALGAYKSSRFADITAFTDIGANIARESANHAKYCEGWGISQEQLDATKESTPCSAYARYILDVGSQGDVLDLYVAVASCLIGYGEVGLWLQKGVKEGRFKIEGNPYGPWIETYSGKDYLAEVTRGIKNLERRIAADSPGPEKIAKLTAIWHDCVALERDFWEMGLKLQ